MFTKLIFVKWLFIASVVQPENGTHNILLQDCLDNRGCKHRGINISHNQVEINYKEGDTVFVEGVIACQDAWGVDETVTNYWATYKSYICNSLWLNVVKERQNENNYHLQRP